MAIEHFVRRALFTCAACLAMPLVAFAQAGEDADYREISGYALSESGLARFSQAAGNLGQLGEALRGGCGEDEESEEDNSIDGMVAKFNAIPGAAEAIEAAGMPVREFVVFQFAVFQAGLAAWALDQPGGQLPPGVSMANVEFFRAHQAEFQQAAAQLPEDDCNGGGDDDEAYGEEAYDESGPDDGYEE